MKTKNPAAAAGSRDFIDRPPLPDHRRYTAKALNQKPYLCSISA